VPPQFVGCGGAPADPDPRGAAIGVGEHGDVGDQGAQQPFAVLLLVMNTRQSPGRSAVSFSNSDHPGNSGSVVPGR
jgi:hypothetical protein